jgi:holo-[acyl-carrier protein] synthase
MPLDKARGADTLPQVPLRVGIDLVVVQDVRDALDDHAERYVARVYTEEEAGHAAAAGAGRPAALASCFAAKEAVVKALGREVPLRSVELLDAGGRPRLLLTGEAARHAAEAGLDEWSVTVDRAGGYACAIVIARGAS